MTVTVGEGQQRQGGGPGGRGIDDEVAEMLRLCRPTAEERERGEDGVQVVFALTRKRLGGALKKKVKVAAVGIYSADGAFPEFKKMLRLAEELRGFWSAPCCASGARAP